MYRNKNFREHSPTFHSKRSKPNWMIRPTSMYVLWHKFINHQSVQHRGTDTDPSNIVAQIHVIDHSNIVARIKIFPTMWNKYINNQSVQHCGTDTDSSNIVAQIHQ